MLLFSKLAAAAAPAAARHRAVDVLAAAVGGGGRQLSSHRTAGEAVHDGAAALGDAVEPRAASSGGRAEETCVFFLGVGAAAFFLDWPLLQADATAAGAAAHPSWQGLSLAAHVVPAPAYSPRRVASKGFEAEAQPEEAADGGGPVSASPSPGVAGAAGGVGPATMDGLVDTMGAAMAGDGARATHAASKVASQQRPLGGPDGEANNPPAQEQQGQWEEQQGQAEVGSRADGNAAAVEAASDPDATVDTPPQAVAAGPVAGARGGDMRPV